MDYIRLLGTSTIGGMLLFSMWLTLRRNLYEWRQGVRRAAFLDIAGLVFTAIVVIVSALVISVLVIGQRLMNRITIWLVIIGLIVTFGCLGIWITERLSAGSKR